MTIGNAMKEYVNAVLCFHTQLVTEIAGAARQNDAHHASLSRLETLWADVQEASRGFQWRADGRPLERPYEQPSAVNAGATKVEGSQEESAHRDLSSSSSVDATARLIEHAREAVAFLHASNDALWDGPPETLEQRRTCRLEFDKGCRYLQAVETLESFLSSVDAVQARVHRIEQELQDIDAVMARRPALDAPTRAENVQKAIMMAAKADEAIRLIDHEKRMRALAEARVSHLEQELNTATKGQWTQAESDAVKWRAQERSDTWLRARDLQSHGDGLDLRADNGKAASDD